MSLNIFIISPPFYSHLNPLLAVGASFLKQGAEVTVGCSKDFQNSIEEQGFEFYDLNINLNKNTGNAIDEQENEEEAKRLKEFFDATKKGAVDTLIFQSDNRQADMLIDPNFVISEIEAIEDQMDVDLYISDILSYGVTIGLKVLQKSFITFCPPHPYTLPDQGHTYGLPRTWPKEILCHQQRFDRLLITTQAVEIQFTKVFNEVLEAYGLEPVDNGFSVVSDLGIIYMYPDFRGENQYDQSAHYIGYAFKESELDEGWKARVQGSEEKILISFGTFLSERWDVIARLVQYLKELKPDAKLFIAGGAHSDKLQRYVDEKDIVEDFLPQSALVEHMDLVIHHGGCNTFTEVLYYGKPMIVMPFSSDQFNIANDVTNYGIGQVLDPNHFDKIGLNRAIYAIENTSRSMNAFWKNHVRKLGPDFVVKRILESVLVK